MQVTKNRSLDGVLDQLNSSNITDAGPADLLVDAPSDDNELLGPGGADIQLLTFIRSFCLSSLSRRPLGRRRAAQARRCDQVHSQIEPSQRS